MKTFRAAVFLSLSIFGIFQLKWFSKIENKASIKISWVCFLLFFLCLFFFFFHVKRELQILPLVCLSILVPCSRDINFSRPHDLCVKSFSVVCPCANLPVFGLYYQPSRGKISRAAHTWQELAPGEELWWILLLCMCWRASVPSPGTRIICESLSTWQALCYICLHTA